jgi:hypothetical protein
VLGQKECNPDRGESFEGVYEENRVTPPLSQDAENIRCANIPAPRRTDINPRNPPSEISRREGSQQIANTRDCERQEPHGDELLRVKTLFRRLAFLQPITYSFPTK